MKQFRTFLAAFLIKDILNFSQGCILWLYMYANGAGLFFYMFYILCKDYSFQSYVSSYSILQHKRKLSRQLHVFELPLLMLNGENCCVTGTTWLSFKQISEIKMYTFNTG